MKLVTFRNQLNTDVGILKNEYVISLSAINEWFCLVNKKNTKYKNILLSMEEIIKNSDSALPYIEKLVEFYINGNITGDKRAKDATFSFNELEILAPLDRPEKIICVGLNYLDHCIETGMEAPISPVIFSKFTNAIIGNCQAIELPINSQEVDFEAELAVVIGKEAKFVSESEANQYIFGYTILNDISARDQQFTDGQWIRGKTADTFSPIGPCIVTKDEIEDPHNLNISLTLNNEVMQDSNTNQLIFSIPYLISYLSQSITLKPGDIIATGTPPGVGMGRSPKIWLKNGDQVAITIENIGTLSNNVTDLNTIIVSNDRQSKGVTS